MAARPPNGYVPPGYRRLSRRRWDGFRSVPYPARVAEAERLMRAGRLWTGPGPQSCLFDRGEPGSIDDLPWSSKRWSSPFHIDLEIARAISRTAVAQSARSTSFSSALPSWLADFNDASNFLDLLRSDGGNNYGQ